MSFGGSGVVSSKLINLESCYSSHEPVTAFDETAKGNPIISEGEGDVARDIYKPTFIIVKLRTLTRSIENRCISPARLVSCAEWQREGTLHLSKVIDDEHLVETRAEYLRSILNRRSLACCCASWNGGVAARGTECFSVRRRKG